MKSLTGAFKLKADKQSVKKHHKPQNLLNHCYFN